ncbi:MAG TPA: dihydroorotate dehydrogenase [Actinobacteria bacterium]|jgi:dihydroorotate dehydrogenase (NAD+) catalytic subunit|nr:dihydroorotate dehydrogenase [Actinomycetota bacterium]HCP62183.1 dihydroorotate dehydrogenase [Actinomycetota bacterium]
MTVSSSGDFAVDGRAAPNGSGSDVPAGEPTLEVDLNGVRFPTPILGASGCFGSGKEMAELIDLRRVGGIVTKSVTLAPRKGLNPPRMAEVSSGMLNAIGLQNPGAEEFLAKDAPFISSAGAPVIVSVAGRSVEEYAQVTLRVRDIPNVVAIEANISCPNVERRNQVFACHPDQAAEVIGSMRRLTTLPIFAKLTADTTSIVDVAEGCVRAGAHGFSCINTLLGMSIDIETGRPRLGAVTGGLSGAAIRPIAVRCIYQVARAFPEMPIIGIGGVVTAEDAIELMTAGAWAVQVGTANFFNPDATIQIAEGVRAFLSRKGLASPADLRARFTLSGRIPEPATQGG